MPPIIAKTPEEIMEQFNERWYERALTIYDTHEIQLWLRSAMQSLLEQAIEEMPKVEDVHGLDMATDSPFKKPDTRTFNVSAYWKNKAITECIKAIKSLQERI